MTHPNKSIGETHTEGPSPRFSLAKPFHYSQTASHQGQVRRAGQSTDTLWFKPVLTLCIYEVLNQHDRVDCLLQPCASMHKIL